MVAKRMRSMRPWTIVASVILIALLGAFGLWRASKAECWQLVGDVVCRVETDRKIVALSFDDGPTREGVDAVLRELDKRNVKATFFLIGDRMAKFPGIAERLQAAGHELGNHSFSHKRMIGSSQTHYRREIARTDALLRQAGATNPSLFRPPFGKRLIGLPLAVEDAGYRTIMWDVADDVAHHPKPQDYARDIVSRVRPGSIILIHPMYYHNSVERAALPLVLDALLEKGYRIVPVGKLLELERP